MWKVFTLEDKGHCQIHKALNTSCLQSAPSLEIKQERGGPSPNTPHAYKVHLALK